MKLRNPSAKTAKIFLLFTFVIFVATVFCMQASAYEVGEIIGNTTYTDIIASINDYNIASVNINGYTGIVAEDLKDYGFNVVWNNDERALYITRSTSNIVSSVYIAPEVPAGKIGTPSDNVLYTDIKTYINGTLVESFNINGKTVINFENLAPFGRVSFNNVRRRLDLDIVDGLNYKISPPTKMSVYSPSGLYFLMNSADGIQVSWWAINNTNKTINYYTTTYHMLNPVGDYSYDKITDREYFTKKIVGPVYPNDIIINFTGKYKTDAYSGLCKYIYLDSIYLEYSDGTSETIYYNHIGSEARGKFVL